MGQYYAKVFMNTFHLLQTQLSDMSITAGILSLFCWTQKHDHLNSTKVHESEERIYRQATNMT